MAAGSVVRRMGGRRPAGVGTLALARGRSRQWIVPGRAGREVVTGTIGAPRAWTVSMISALSMPWRATVFGLLPVAGRSWIAAVRGGGEA